MAASGAGFGQPPSPRGNIYANSRRSSSGGASDSNGQWSPARVEELRSTGFYPQAQLGHAYAYPGQGVNSAVGAGHPTFSDPAYGSPGFGTPLGNEHPNSGGGDWRLSPRARWQRGGGGQQGGGGGGGGGRPRRSGGGGGEGNVNIQKDYGMFSCAKRRN